MEWNPASKRGKKKLKIKMMLILFVGILQSVLT
jgi:hypothetical protein